MGLFASKKRVAEENGQPRKEVVSSQPAARGRALTAAEESKLKEYEVLRTSFKKLQAKLAEQARTLEEQEGYVKDVTQKLSEEQRRAKFSNQELLELDSSIRSAHQNIKRLETRIKEDEEDLLSQDEFLRLQSDRLRNLQKTIDEDQEDLLAQDEHLRIVYNKLKTASKERKGDQEDLLAQEEHLRMLYDKLKAANSAREGDQEDILAQEAHLRMLYEKLKKANNAREGDQEDILAQEAHLRMLYEKLNSLEKARKGDQEDLKAQEDHMRMLYRRLKEVEESRDACHDDLKAQDEHLRLFYKRLGKMEQSRDGSIEDLIDQDEHLRAIYKKMKGLEQSQEANLKNLQGELKRSELLVDGLRTELSVQEAKSTQAQQDMSTNYSSSSSIENAQSDALNATNALRPELFQPDSAHLEEHIEEQHAQLEKMQTQLASAESDNKSLNESLEALQLELASEKRSNLNFLESMLKSDPYIQLDVNGIVARVGSNWRKQFKHFDIDLIGKHIDSLVDTSKGEGTEFSRIFSKLSLGFPVSRTEYVINGTGSSQQSRVRYVPIMNGNLLHAVWRMDTIDEKYMEPFSYEWNLVNNAIGEDQPIFLLEADGAINDASPYAKQYWLNTKRPHGISEKFEQFFDDEQRVLNSIELVQKLTLSENFEIEMNFNDPYWGEQKWVFSWQMIGTEGRHKWIATGRTATNKKANLQAKDALKQRDKLFSGYIKGMSNTLGFVEYDLDGNVMFANDYILNMLGRTKGEVEQSHHRLFVGANISREEAYTDLWTHLEQGRSQRRSWNYIDKQGEVIQVESTFTPIKDLDNQVVLILELIVNKSKAIGQLDDIRSAWEAFLRNYPLAAQSEGFNTMQQLLGGNRNK